LSCVELRAGCIAADAEGGFYECIENISCVFTRFDRRKKLTQLQEKAVYSACLEGGIKYEENVEVLPSSNTSNYFLRRYPHLRDCNPTCAKLRTGCIAADVKHGFYLWAENTPFMFVRERRRKKLRQEQEEAVYCACLDEGIEYVFNEEEDPPSHLTAIHFAQAHSGPVPAHVFAITVARENPLNIFE